MATQFGPLMSKLTSQEQLFVLLFFENGGNQTQALVDAGWDCKNRNSARNAAHYHIHRKEIMEAIKEESQRRTMLMAPKVQAALENIVDHPEHPDHFKALKMMRDDAGISRAVERVLNVKVEVSNAEKIEEIKRFALSHNMDPKTLLGFDPDGATTKEPVEAEFSEVDAEAEDRALGIID